MESQTPPPLWDTETKILGKFKEDVMTGLIFNSVLVSALEHVFEGTFPRGYSGRVLAHGDRF